MKRLLAALLCLPSLAFASCFVHPDNGLTYCTAPQECPAGTVWSSSEACRVSQAAAPTAGVYTPPIYYPGGQASEGNLVASSPEPSFWIRTGSFVTVTGALSQEVVGTGRVEFFSPLPVASRVSDHSLSGVLTTESGLAGIVRPMFDYPPGYARFTYFAPAAGIEVVRFTFTYEVLP